MPDYQKPDVSVMEQNVHTLTFSSGQKLYIVGTAHVSHSSVELVEKIIREINPDTISVELDEKRHQKLLKKNMFEDLDIIEIIRKNQLFYFIGQFIMASFQKKMAEKTGSQPGAEFKKAIELAKERQNTLVLADRDIGTTLKRAWRLTPFWQKSQFMASLLLGSFGMSEDWDKVDIEELKKEDAIENMVKMFSEGLPKTKEVLIDERDIYLASEIYQHLGQITVAVVGAGHVPGMLRQFEQGISIEKKEKISTVPPAGQTGKIIGWVIPALVMALFVWGFMHGDKKAAEDMIVTWILVTGLLSALGCLLALAHPLTILTGFIAAPITTLNPAIGVGFFTAIVQTFLVKPRLKDFEEIQDRTLKVRQWWSNRVTKVFLVFILSSIGASIGTFIALPLLAKMFRH
jgi:pheromone shutdown-related protein TraB